jgi:hypothetical protein
MKNKTCGFDYQVSLKKIRQYQKMPLEKKLTWLYQGNLLRQSYPRKIIELQDKFREGKI